MNEKPLTVHEVVNLTGITARTLHYYDEIGLLKPSIVTEAKYRLYTDTDLCRLQEVLFFREVGFALKEIKNLLNSPYYNRTEALEKHLCILEAQRERIDGLISLVKAEISGGKTISFSEFSNSKVMELQSQFQKEVLLSIIKTTYLRKKGRLEKGKKNTVADESYLNLAEKMLFSELCLVLGKNKDEVHNFIAESVNKK